MSKAPDSMNGGNFLPDRASASQCSVVFTSFIAVASNAYTFPLLRRDRPRPSRPSSLDWITSSGKMYELPLSEPGNLYVL